MLPVTGHAKEDAQSKSTLKKDWIAKKYYFCFVEKIGYIEIQITGSRGNLDLSPDNYDIREIITILENAEKLL